MAVKRSRADSLLTFSPFLISFLLSANAEPLIAWIFIRLRAVKSYIRWCHCKSWIIYKTLFTCKLGKHLHCWMHKNVQNYLSVIHCWTGYDIIATERQFRHPVSMWFCGFKLQEAGLQWGKSFDSTCHSNSEHVQVLRLCVNAEYVMKWNAKLTCGRYFREWVFVTDNV